MCEMTGEAGLWEGGVEMGRRIREGRIVCEARGNKERKRRQSTAAWDIHITVSD